MPLRSRYRLPKLPRSPIGAFGCIILKGLLVVFAAGGTESPHRCFS